MIQFYPDVTLVPWLKRGVAPTLYYWLYSNNYTPVFASVLGDFSHHTSFDPETVDVADFTLQSTAGHIGRITAPDLVFTNTDVGSQGVYGYFVTDDESGGSPAGDLVCAARFDSAPIVVPAAGTHNVIPTFGDTQED